MFSTAEVNAQDVNNYSVSREGIGRAAEIPDLIAGLYHFMYQSLIPTLDTDRCKIAALLCLPLNAKHLITGINSLYRLYASQMFREARSATESTAMANMILHDPKAYAVFASDKSVAEAARSEARKLFVPRNLFGKVNPYLLKLQDHYNFASERAHTNRMSSMRHILMQPMADESTFSLIEIMPKDANIELKAYVHWSCLVHMDILDTVATFIFPEFDAKQSEFQEKQKAIDSLMDALSAHVQRLEWKRRDEYLTN
jgi:hypothetical protein